MDNQDVGESDARGSDDAAVDTPLADDTSSPKAAFGAFCAPVSVPVGGFLESEVFVETESSSCETSFCVVYNLAGDPSPTCTENCATREEAEKRAFCTSTCTTSADTCPEAYTCQRVLDFPVSGATDFCVRDEILEER